MPTLFLVRHGQASLASDDYDQLSELGQRQCEALGRWFAERGQQFEAVYLGTLRRHAQSLAAIAAGHGALPAAQQRPALDEYDAQAVIAAVHGAPLAPPTDREAVRRHFRLLRDGLEAWIDGRAQPRGLPAHADFRAAIDAVLDEVRARHQGDVLLVSSGGPISTATASVLQAPMRTAVDLNLRLRNSALTEFAFTPKRHVLLSFNSLSHLDAPERRGWASWS